MRRSLSVVLLLILCLMFCGAPPETEAPKESTEDVQFQLLSAGELQKFVMAFPIFKAELEKKGEKWDRLGEGETFADWVQRYSTANKDIAELDAKLKATGMSWEEFAPAMAKTTAAVGAVMMDSLMSTMKSQMQEAKQEMAELEAKLKDPAVPEQEKSMIRAQMEMMKGMQEAMETQDTVFAKVPAQNKELVRKHWDKIVNIFED